MASSRGPRTAAFADPIAPPEARRAAGKALRATAPRTSHAGWEPAPDRADPVEVMRSVEADRQQDLLPLRHSRMAATPFAFLRGSALQMAHDLATTPSSGLQVQLCGDAHISNFGVFASPERRLVFDLNDFDETTVGPFEWDVKRLAASIVVAGRQRGLDATETRRACEDAVAEYRDRMDVYSLLSRLDLWYARLDTDELLALANPDVRRRSEVALNKMSTKNNLKAFDKLTAVIDGQRRIIDDPPLVMRADGPHLRARLDALFAGYMKSLSSDRRGLFEQYRFVDFARKVVGVGSVGTRCYMALFQGPNGGPLFLQVKEACRPSPDLALGRKPRRHQGQRVVEGQRGLQAVSDVLLGWSTDEEEGHHYFIRQLWDSKGAFDVELMRPAGFRGYIRICAWALARAHARTGDPAIISGYIGTSETFPRSIADFAEAYADQTERDHAALVAAIAAGTMAAD